MDDQEILNLRVQIQNRISCFLKQARRESGLSLREVSSLMGDESLTVLLMYEEGRVPAFAFARLVQIYGVPLFEAHQFLDDIYSESVP